MIEPVFADGNSTDAATAFYAAEGSAARSEWRLIAATHNLLDAFDVILLVVLGDLVWLDTLVRAVWSAE